MKDGVRLVFDIEITTKNGVIFCTYLWRDQKVGATFTDTIVSMSIEKTNIKLEIMMKTNNSKLLWNGDDP